MGEETTMSLSDSITISNARIIRVGSERNFEEAVKQWTPRLLNYE